MRRTPRATVPRALSALAIHATLVTWLTWPLARHLGTHLPNTSVNSQSDPLLITWALAWMSHALVTAPSTFADANIYYPASHALFYGEAGFGALPYFLPPFLLTGNPTLGINLTFLVSLALTGSTLHLVVHRWTGSHLGGVVAGWTFLTNRWVIWNWIPVAPNYAVLQYFPLIILLAAVAPTGLRRSLELLALVVLQGLTSVYVAAAALIPLGALGLGRLARRASRCSGGRLLAVVGVAALVLSAVYSGYLRVRSENPRLALQTMYPEARLRESNLPWGIFAGPMAVSTATTVVLIGVGGLSAALRARHEPLGAARPAWTYGAFWTLAGIAISLTPRAHWFGAPIVLPQAIVAYWVPIYEVLRVVKRLGVAALMGLAILAGTALAECTHRLQAWSGARTVGAVASPALTALVMAAMYVLRPPPHETIGVRVTAPAPPHTYPLQKALEPTSSLLDVLRRPGGPLLELPVSGALGVVGAAPQARAMYRSIFHWRRLLNGYHGYWPAGFPERMALARRLPEPGALASLRRETGLELLLVHTQDFGAADRKAWLAVAGEGQRQDLGLLARDGDDLLFEVIAGPGREATNQGPLIGGKNEPLRVPTPQHTPREHPGSG
jgi:hypothetical protein